jgi:S1-C subfamily serine protease
MRIYSLLPTVFIASLATNAAAQSTIVSARPLAATGSFGWTDEPHAVIGITTSGSGSSRDTLGLMVSFVRPGSPADKAGLEEGNRIAAINGVSLKLAAADIGDYDEANAMTRRLTRELDKINTGDDVTLSVYSGGVTKTVKVKTMAPADLYQAEARKRESERPTLGISLATTGNSHDTLGVFVMSVIDGGPAAKAGIEEGSRIASINGVDVRASRRDDDDTSGMIVIRNSNVNRLERELQTLHPGDDVDLRVYYNRQYRDVKFKVGHASDLPHRGNTTFMTGDNFVMPAMGSITINGDEIGGRLRDALETARTSTGDAMMGVGRAMERIGNRVSW